MTNTQLYLAIGLPTLISLIGLIFNGTLFLWLHSDVKELRDDIRVIMSKLVDLDTRLTRVEERLGIK